MGIRSLYATLSYQVSKMTEKVGDLPQERGRSDFLSAFFSFLPFAASPTNTFIQVLRVCPQIASPSQVLPAYFLISLSPSSHGLAIACTGESIWKLLERINFSTFFRSSQAAHWPSVKLLVKPKSFDEIHPATAKYCTPPHRNRLFTGLNTSQSPSCTVTSMRSTVAPKRSNTKLRLLSGTTFPLWYTSITKSSQVIKRWFANTLGVSPAHAEPIDANKTVSNQSFFIEGY